MLGNRIKMRKEIFFIALALIIFSSAVYAQAVFEHPGCSADRKSFCTIETTCDFLTGSCTNEYLTCDTCPDTTLDCDDGTVASCQNYCQEAQFGLSAGCTSCIARCTGTTTIPTVVIPFDVLSLKELEITAEPETRNALAGSAAQYIFHIRNRNPFAVNAQLSFELPSGWSVSSLQSVQLRANGVSDISFTITSAADAVEKTYPIAVAVFTSDIREPFNFVRVNIAYSVVTQQPFTVAIQPLTQQMPAGQKADYEITVTNNDPPGLSESRFVFSSVSPRNWRVRFEDSSLRIPASESLHTVMSVTSPDDAEDGSYSINFDVSRNDEKQTNYASYVVSLCGNNICDPNEEQTCSDDCPYSPFICSGRCEQQTDTGVAVSSTLRDFSFIKFIVCKKGATESQCISAYDSENCGLSKNCLCGYAFSTSCNFRCVDTKGAYYMLAQNTDRETVKSIAYSFICPFVNITEITQLKDDFSNAADSYEQSRSVIEERIAAGEDSASLFPCYDGLALIISTVSQHANYLNEVVRYPAVSNTTFARQATATVRRNIRNYYNSYCQGARGLLVVDSTTPPQSTVVGVPASASVKIKSIGIPYYGYAKCIITSPRGTNTVYTDSCSQITNEKNYVFSINPDREGEWKIKCESFGSLSADCSSASLHSEGEEKTFSVHSNDVFVSSISGTCTVNTELKCYVETNTPKTCVGCRVGNIECSFVRQENNRAVFDCSSQFAFPGTKQLTGRVFTTADCNAINPVEKRTSVTC